MSDMTDLYIDTMVEEAMVGEQPSHRSYNNRRCRGMADMLRTGLNTSASRVVFWKMGNGKLIAISDMTTRHLNNTIRFLKRQIDGSAHDDFCWDNINAMEEELRKRGISNGENCKC